MFSDVVCRVGWLRASCVRWLGYRRGRRALRFIIGRRCARVDVGAEPPCDLQLVWSRAAALQVRFCPVRLCPKHTATIATIATMPPASFPPPLPPPSQRFLSFIAATVWRMATALRGLAARPRPAHNHLQINMLPSLGPSKNVHVWPVDMLAYARVGGAHAPLPPLKGGSFAPDLATAGVQARSGWHPERNFFCLN